MKKLVFDDFQVTGKQYQVDIVENGHEVIQKIANNTYDVILSDVRMPSINGMDLYKTLETMEDKSLVSKVLFITGDILGSDVSTFLSEKKLPFVTKPIDLPDLKSKIAEIIRR